MSSHALVAPRREAASAVPRKAKKVGRAEASRGPLGGEPHVSLLPPEVNDFHKAKAARRRLGVAVVAVLVLVGAGVGFAAYLAMSAQSALESARQTSQDLLAQQAEFSELRLVQNGISLAEAGQLVGASTEIDWTDYLVSLQSTLPAGVTINTVTIDSASPFVDYPQSTIPLEGSRVATLAFTASSPTLPSIRTWLDGLATLEGFADASPDSVAIQDDGSYLVNITMHINADAFAQRFSEETQ